jgi:outer membrane protein assembly factor BamB
MSPVANALAAYDLQSGSLRFTLQPAVVPNQAPVIPSSGLELAASPLVFTARIDKKDQQLVAATTRDGIVHVSNAETGEWLWQSHFLQPTSDEGEQGILANGAWSGSALLFAANQQDKATLFAHDPLDGKVLWHRELDATVLGRITVANGVGFVGAGAQLIVFDPSDGTILHTVASVSAAATVAGIVSVADGVVAFGTGATRPGLDDAARGELVILGLSQP